MENLAFKALLPALNKNLKLKYTYVFQNCNLRRSLLHFQAALRLVLPPTFMHDGTESKSRFLKKNRSGLYVYGCDNTLPRYINNNTYQRFAAACTTVWRGHCGWRVRGGSTHNIFNTYGLTMLPSWDKLQTYAGWMECILNRERETNLLHCIIITHQDTSRFP
jgi:hypothetical protein